MSDENTTTRTSIDVLSDFVNGRPLNAAEHEELRGEVRLMLDTLSMVRQSLGTLATQANERSTACDPGERVDPWVIGYLAGKSRESQSAAGALGALQNSMDVWAASRRAAEGGA